MGMFGRVRSDRPGVRYGVPQWVNVREVFMKALEGRPRVIYGDEIDQLPASANLVLANRLHALA